MKPVVSIVKAPKGFSEVAGFLRVNGVVDESEIYNYLEFEGDDLGALSRALEQLDKLGAITHEVTQFESRL